MEKDFDKALQVRLADRMDSLNYYSWYFNHLKINDEVDKQISKEKPFVSFLMKFMNLPMNIYRFSKHNIMLFEFYMCAKEVEYLKMNLGLTKTRIENGKENIN